MKTRKITMAAGGLTETRERSPKWRVSDREGVYFKRCIDLLEKESMMNPGYAISMRINHATREVTFNYRKEDEGLKRMGDTLRNIDVLLRKIQRRKMESIVRDIKKM